MAARLVALCAASLIACARAEASLFSSISGGKRGAAAKKVVDVHGLGPTLDRYALALAAFALASFACGGAASVAATRELDDGASVRTLKTTCFPVVASMAL